MGFAAIVGMGVSMVGVALVFATFQETKRTADEQKRSVEAFIDAERPHLRVHPVSFTGPPDEKVIALKVENYGSSPAVLLDFAWLLTSSPKFPDLKEAKLTKFGSSPKVEAGARVAVGPIKGAMTVGYIAGRARFLSRFSPEHETYFLWEICQLENGEMRLKVKRPDHSMGWPKDS